MIEIEVIGPSGPDGVPFRVFTSRYNPAAPGEQASRLCGVVIVCRAGVPRRENLACHLNRLPDAGAVTGNATYASFLSSLLAVGAGKPGVHIC